MFVASSKFSFSPKNTFPSSTAPLPCLSLLAATVQLWNCCWGLLTSRPSPKQRLSKRGWTRSYLGSFVLYNYAWSGGPLYPNYPNIVGLEFPLIYPSDSVFPAQLHHQIGGPLGIPFWITKLKFKTPAMLAVDVFFCGNVGVPHQNCNLPEVGNMISTNFTDKNWIHFNFRITLTDDSRANCRDYSKKQGSRKQDSWQRYHSAITPNNGKFPVFSSFKGDFLVTCQPPMPAAWNSVDGQDPVVWRNGEIGIFLVGKAVGKKNAELLGRRGGEIPLKWVINPVINWRSRVIFHSFHWGELPRLRFVSHKVPPESPIPYGKLMGIGVPSGRQNIFHGLLDHYHLAIPKDWNYLMEMQFLLTTEINTYRTNYLD